MEENRSNPTLDSITLCSDSTVKLPKSLLPQQIYNGEYVLVLDIHKPEDFYDPLIPDHMPNSPGDVPTSTFITGELIRLEDYYSIKSETRQYNNLLQNGVIKMSEYDINLLGYEKKEEPAKYDCIINDNKIAFLPSDYNK